MHSMSETALHRQSAEYFEILSEVFAGLVARSQASREGCGDITPSLVQCLQFIYLHGPSTIRKIASGMSITVPAASQLVERLVQKNLVTREHSTEDRRRARVELTEHGRLAIIEARSARIKWLDDLLVKLPDEKREALVDSLEEFIRIALESSSNSEDACARCGIDHLAFCVVNTARVASTGEQIKDY